MLTLERCSGQKWEMRVSKWRDIVLSPWRFILDNGDLSTVGLRTSKKMDYEVTMLSSL